MAGHLAALIGPMLSSMTGAVAAKTAAAGAAKVAATEAAGAVAAKTASTVTAGMANAGTGAAKVAPVAAKFSVLENPAVGMSAHDLTRSLAGAGQAGGGQSAVPASQLPRATRLPVPPVRNGGVAAQAGTKQPAAEATQPREFRIPPVRNGGVAAQARAAQAAGQSQAPPVQSQPAGQPKGPIQTAADRFRAWREARAANRAEAKSLSMPVTQQVKGMTLPERLQRLSDSGNLLSKDAVTQRTGIPEPSDRQIAQESERNEEQERLQRLAKLDKAFEGLNGPLNIAQKGLLVFGVAGAVGSAAIGGAKAMAAFTKGVIASNERLRRFDPAIAASIAQMERQDLILEARTARSTSGSATTLNSQWMALREETQNLHVTVKSIYNILATATAVGLRVGNFLLQQSRFFRAVETAADWYNWLAGSGRQENMAYEEFLQNIAQNNWRKPRDFDPNAGNGGNR
jgi:hypothetical protein